MTPELTTLKGDAGTVGCYAIAGKGVPLVMVHASGAGPRTLLRLAGLVSARNGRPIWSVGLDGYDTTRMSGANALDRHSAALKQVLDHIGEPADLFGHSVGGFMSLQMARQAGSTIRSVTAVEPVAVNVLREHAEDAEALAIDDDAVALIAPGMARNEPEAAIRGFITLWNGVDWDRLPDGARAAILAMAPQILADTNAIRFAGGFAADYREISCPVHLIGTGHSPATAWAIINRLVAANPSWRSTRIDKAGHMGPIERPELFAGLID